MLTIIADAMLNATRRRRWDAPEHWKSARPLRGQGAHDRDHDHWRRILNRDAGLW